MNNKKYDVALLVHTCDRYEFLYEGFYYFFKKYWDHQINCNCYFATEEKNVSIHGFTNIKSGSGEWADRLAYLLKNEITENYVLYFQEDMWLNKTVNPHFFNQLFDVAKQYNWQQVKLHSSEVYQTIATDEFIEGFNIAKLNNEASDFLMSHQVTLWNKEYLLQQLHKGEHPWRNERKGTKRLKKLNPEIYHADYFAENGKVEINKNKNPVHRCEYQTISINATLNENVQPFIQDLMNGDADEIKYGERLQYHLANKITHDGKQKPRKEDIFKKIKNKLQGK